MPSSPSSSMSIANESKDHSGDPDASAQKEPEAEPPASSASYLRILSYGARKNGIYAMVLGLICAMASGVALPLMNIFFGRLVGDFNEYFIPGTTLDEQKFKSSISKYSLYIVYLFIAKFFLTYISMLCFRLISLRASSALRLEYIQSLFALPVSKLDEISVGTVTNAITALSNTIQQSVSDRLAVLFQSLALLIAAYAIAFRYSWALTLVVSSAILFVILGFCVTVPFLIKGHRKVDQADEKHVSIAADTFGSMRTVLSLGAEASLSQKYSDWIHEARKRGLKMSPVTGFHMALLFFAMYVSFSLAFWFGLKLYREGHITSVSTVITVFFSVLLVVSILGGIAAPITAIVKAISASGPFFGIIDAEGVSPAGLAYPDVSSQADIVFRNVTFAYPSRSSSQVLKGFNARFERGKTTALVGPSGSGKSTIVALIERWYQLEAVPEDEKGIISGDILVDGHNINELQVKWWRAQVGLVQQEPFLFNDTVFSNVAFGLIGSAWENDTHQSKMERVVSACKEACADEFIARLPLGYSTMVGEGGITLSGGQRQRLAIARSIVKQPPILILDEATSSIDVRGEKIVQAALDRVSQDRTTIMIAHRLSTVRKADKIIVMKDGANIEEGSHDGLTQKGGLYHSMVHAQQLQPLSNDVPSGTEDQKEPEMQKEEVQPQLYSVDEDTDQNAQQIHRQEKPIGFFKILWVFSYEQRRYWFLYAAALTGALGAGSGYALQSWLFAKLVQAFQFTGQKLVDAANFWALMLFILALAMAAFYFVMGFSTNSLSMFIASTYRTDYFSSLLQKPISFYDREENSSGTLISRLTTDPKQLQELFGSMGIYPLVAIFNVTGCVAIAFAFGWKLALVTFFAAMPFIFFSAFMRIRYEVMFESMNAEVYAESSKFATEAIRAFRTVMALTMEDSIIQRYEGLLAQQRQKAMRKAWYATLVYAFSDSVELASMALTFWYGGQLLASREYNPVAFYVVYIAIIQGSQSAGQFFSFGPNVAQAKASANRILGARQLSAGQVQHHSAPTLPPLETSIRPSVELKDVSFSYASRNTPAFTNLNVSIEAGQFVAFVGPSGCGKSTIISLLERFYDPTQGTILFGGHDIRTIDLASYRQALSLVAQEPRLFDGTIRDNLLLGLEEPNKSNNNSQHTEEQMIQACKDAEIHDFITSLPHSYLTDLGVNAQTSLSGGQKQRLCIARALLRSPRLLLLDEATSSLDSQSEKLVQEAMERLAAKRNLTILAVAHRLATVQKADVIFVFGEGREGRGSVVLERGSHGELLARRGAYWQMCQAQALDR